MRQAQGRNGDEIAPGKSPTPTRLQGSSWRQKVSLITSTQSIVSKDTRIFSVDTSLYPRNHVGELFLNLWAPYIHPIGGSLLRERDREQEQSLNPRMNPPHPVWPLLPWYQVASTDWSIPLLSSPMKPDLQGLEITKGELRRLIGFAPDHLFAPFWSRVGWLSLGYFVLNYGTIALVRIALLSISPLTLPWDIHFWLSVGLAIPTAIYHRWSWLQENASPPLRNLVRDVQQFNRVIKAITINDQLEEAGNPGVAIQDRDRVLEALWLTREDLARALKTERILRDNKEFIANNAPLFDNNIAALTSLQVHDQATEHGRLLNEALQIAMSTQDEIRRLHN